MAPRNSVTAQERTMLMAQLASITTQGQQGNYWHCTQSGCTYRSRIPEYVQAHFQETHMPSGQNNIRLLRDQPLCETVSKTKESWSSHKSRDHTGTAAQNAQNAPHPPVTAPVVVPVTTPLPAAVVAAPFVPTSSNQPVAPTGEHDDDSDTDDDHDMTSDDQLNARIRRNVNASFEAMQLSDTSSFNQTGGVLENNNASANQPDTREASSITTAPRAVINHQVERFLETLSRDPDQLRKSEDLHFTLLQVFTGGSFIDSKRFRDEIAHSEPCPRYRCFILASTIMWLTRKDANQELHERLQRHARIAQPTNAPEGVLVYQQKTNSPYYDFLYGLYIRGKFDPSGYSWFTDGRLVDVVGYVAPEEEADDIERYCGKMKHTKEYFDTQSVNRKEYMRNAWMSALEKWLEGYDDEPRRTLGEWLMDEAEARLGVIDEFNGLVL